jgi:cytidyltransferase-like protein
VILSVDDLAFYRSKAVIYLDGAFDPLHAGHIRYLQSAVEAFPSSLFIVGIASDDDIRAKGREPLLDQRTRADVVASLKCVDLVLLKDRPTEHILTKLKPAAYVKGKDWEGKLPPEQLTACALQSTQIVYLAHGNDDHGSDFLREWWRKQSDRDLTAMEQWIAAHPSTPPERYDAAYFTREQLVYKYTLEERRIAEGARPDRIKDLWPHAVILDVGCGPGCLLALLRERGLRAFGVEPSKIPACLPELETFIHRGTVLDVRSPADVVISREVLEHLTIPELSDMVAQLFTVARHAVYITTRFHPVPSSAFSVTDQPEVDPTHQTLLTHQLLRALCVMNGGVRRLDWEQHLDFQGFGCTLAYEVVR